MGAFELDWSKLPPIELPEMLDDTSPSNILAKGVYGTDRFLIEDQIIKPAQWVAVSSRAFQAVSMSYNQLTAGCYNITRDHNNGKPVFLLKEVKTDEILHFRDSLSDKMIKEMAGFWNSHDKFKKHKVLQRRGYLLYGPQGTGKSSIVQLVIYDTVRRGGLVLICDNPKYFAEGLAVARQVEPSRPIVCIFEDIDAIIKRYGEDQLLAILDGTDKIDRVLNIATTNYPEILDKRIISRPRRFDRVYKIPNPSAKLREAFLKVKLPKGTNVKKWTKDTEGLSFAAMTELIVSVFCLGNEVEDTIKVLKDMEKGHPNSEDFGTKEAIGFGGDKLTKGDLDDDDDL